MKKRIILIVLMSMLIMGVVSAASINGDYKGNPIVKVKSNGKVIKPESVPAINYNGSTMVPISMLKQLGATVTWDAKTYSVDVKIKSTTVDNDSIVISKKLIIDLQKKSYELGGLGFTYSYGGGTSTFVEVIFHSKNVDTTKDIASIANISKLILETDAGIVQIGYYVNNIESEIVYINREDIEDYKNGITNLTQFLNKWIITNSHSNESSNSNSTYDFDDAVAELGFTSSSSMTVDARNLAIELLEIRKTKPMSDYSVQDALKDLGITSGIPTLATLKQAVKLISLH